MAKVREVEQRGGLAELQAWYLGSLRPKLAGAARAGRVAPTAAAALDRDLRVLLDLPDTGRERAA